MKTTLPLLFLLLVSLSSFAQTKFEKGYYTTFQGDSVQAYIKNEDWNRNPEFIEVKNSPESSTSEKLTLQQVKRFKIEGGELYETFMVDVDTSPTDLNKLAPNAPPVIVRDTAMLRNLVTGPVNFYVYTDRNSKTHYYLSKGDEEPRELLYQKLKRVEDGKTAFVTLELYKGLLQAYFTDCEEVKSQISKTAFKQSQLMELVLAYNTCIDSTTIAVAPVKEKGELRIGLAGGISLVSFKFSAYQSFEELVNSDFNGQGVSGGLALNYTLPRAHGKWVIVNELMLKQYAANGKYTTATENYNTDLKLVYLGLNSMLRYSFNTGGIRPFINLGMANNAMLSDDSYQESEKNRYGTVREYEGKPLNDVRKYEQALLVGAGVAKGKFAAEARLEKGNGFSIYNSLKSSKTAYMLQLTYFVR